MWEGGRGCGGPPNTPPPPSRRGCVINALNATHPKCATPTLPLGPLRSAGPVPCPLRCGRPPRVDAMKRQRPNEPDPDDADEPAPGRLPPDVLDAYAVGLHKARHPPPAASSYAKSCGLREGETLEAFLERAPPATTPPGVAHWLTVECPRGVLQHPVPYGDPPNIEALLQDWMALCARDTPSAEHITFLAQKHALCSGAWVVPIGRALVNQGWAAVARATLAGRLGTFARCSTRSLGGDQHLLHVCTWSFLDAADVFRVRQAMAAVGVTYAVSYRPDIYNYLGVYQGNRWGIDVQMYTR